MPQKAPQKCLIEALYEIGDKHLKIFDKELDLTKTIVRYTQRVQSYTIDTQLLYEDLDEDLVKNVKQSSKAYENPLFLRVSKQLCKDISRNI